MPNRLWTLALGLSAMLAISQAMAADDPGFKRVFNGKDLKGWQAPDMTYWSVEDGAITGRVSEEHPCTANQYLVWQNGELDDFELKLQHRLTGSPGVNGGIQFRSRVLPDADVAGYQVDTNRDTDWLVRLYDEHGRHTLAWRGKQTRWTPEGMSQEQPLPDGANSGKAAFSLDDWHEYHLIAQVGHLKLLVDGALAAETWDEDPKQRDLSGILALQLHSGPPMAAQFKDIRLKRLKLSDGRKKIVLVAGKPSHGPGEHEYNAGCSLLKKCLDENVPQVQTALYLNGWPADGTAFDNADAIMLYMNGGPKHPVMGRNRLAEIDALVKQGVGLVCAHFAVEVPAEKGGPAFQDWIGGYYENRFSTNPHWSAKVELAPEHPITRGVEPFEALDEWYFNMRFRPNNQDVVSILKATPSDQTRQGETSYPRGPYPHIVDASGRSETLMWAVERPDGGRGVGFTGGHFHRNWRNDDLRKLMLNALLWAAKVEVPSAGVESQISDEEIRANLDKK